ncbi:hypothetical protein LWF15_28925 [Kineosporia rhizophila]|nr:hypothetical protein [Kineosporia rhizophila]MCE0539530.1 hypothetical protein [Kineosporia rhizophila]
MVENRCWADENLDRLCDTAPTLTAPARVELVLQHLRPVRDQPDQHTLTSDALDLTADVEAMRVPAVGQPLQQPAPRLRTPARPPRPQLNPPPAWNQT